MKIEISILTINFFMVNGRKFQCSSFLVFADTENYYFSHSARSADELKSSLVISFSCQLKIFFAN